MYFYIAELPGMYLTGYVIVSAESREQAIEKIFELAAENGFACSRQEITIKLVFTSDDEVGYVIWNGDY